MTFKRYNGFSGSIPQNFIDKTLINCPVCGGNHPHWSLKMEMTLDIEGNKYLFKCEQCGCILSGRVPDVTGFNKTPLTTTGFIKKLKGKDNNVMYMIIEDAGTQSDMKKYEGKEMPLVNLTGLRFNENNHVNPSNMNNNQSKFKFCTSCGAKLKHADKFCTNCGNKI